MTALFSKKKTEDKKEVPSENQPEASKPSPAFVKGSLVKGIYVSEKAGRGKGLNQYVFEVARNANRPEVKKEIEKKFGVHVKKINILNRPSKKVTVGRYQGTRPGLRKAIVTLKEGESIPE